MQNALVDIYETGLRGRPVHSIEAGDLADPSGKSPWQRVATLWSTMVDIVRETREMQPAFSDARPSVTSTKGRSATTRQSRTRRSPG